MREIRKSGSVGAPGWQRPGATRSSDNDDEGLGADAYGGSATQRGSWDHDDESHGSDDLGEGTTQRGSSESDDRKRDGARDVDGREADKRKREHDRWSEINSRLLQAMGGRGRWIPDTLIEASGLSASEVNSALTFLQLSGRIRRRAYAFEPI